MPTPARTSTARSRPIKPSPDSDLEVLEHDEEAGTIRARLFGGETFLMADNVNALLLFNIGDEDEGGAGAVIKLLKSLVLIEPQDADADMDEVRKAEWKRFNDFVGSQPKLSVERLMRIVNDIAEVSGKDQPDSSGS